MQRSSVPAADDELQALGLDLDGGPSVCSTRSAARMLPPPLPRTSRISPVSGIWDSSRMNSRDETIGVGHVERVDANVSGRDSRR